ncbi:Lrp/AsnC family transcriptional regulator [Marinomonas mediterranea]|jgi:transcriptional regulator, AsnC family|uniref:Transcriptional regulator, AsnC family n=1 Tax=Marinomonas mediterranea (strain ATCC 700492 / JCM 21426 / NBRC 103028 / MMB-1) TaxID=717774 RepID=F2K1J9_MARM1|nr:Lrp/AsnC family transcriptional regulator [Marinomonas mediterranea]ADZ92229.1 transcriptional regulator, AsnC family [Marinomonas mediterranea MMB-1]WCN10186.1 AsnC family transcriptional regulator [Marinomonas mediterranea]WCN14231.1 AsnC family transcriptional regulator [Marinomonas mediterranea]WCN18287.1 AsnC family transcriptional regulator [Marinomonas mediterranea MMB-1]
MDKINWKIIKALEENARLSYAELGKQVHLSAPAVAERVRKLEEAGVITGYGAKINLEKVGIPITAIVECQVYRTKEREFKALVLSQKEVVSCYNVTGPYAFILKVSTHSLSKLDALLERLIDLSDTNTMMVLTTPIDRELPLNAEDVEALL